MYKLFPFFTLLLCCVCLPRTPRIYNVLISTKKNLSPSHALPVYEPVLKTTSLGLAFPPVYYQQPFQFLQPTPINQVLLNNGNVQYSNQQIQYPTEEKQVNNGNSNISENYKKLLENVNDPKNVVANLKRNPEIPDVPPPALSVKN